MSIFRKCIQIVSKHLAYWALFIAVLFTLFVATIYWLSDAIEQRQDEIAQWIGDELNYPVEIESTGLHWLGLEPKLQLQSVTVFQNDGRTELLSLGQLYFGLDVLQSIKKSEPILNDISVMGLNIKLVRDTLGELQVQGFNKLKTKAVATESMDWLAWIKSLNSFNFKSININYIDLKEPSLSGDYTLQNATLNYHGKRWSTVATLRPPSQFGSDITFNAQGQLNDDLLKTVWQWQLDASQLQLSSLSTVLAWQDVALKRAEVTATVLGSNIGLDIESIQAQISLSNAEMVTLQNDIKIAPVLIDSVSGIFSWKREQQSWQFISDKLQIAINGDDWPLTGFNINKQKDKWLITSDYLRLSDITSLGLLSTHTPENIRQQKPAGDIEKFTVEFSQQGLKSLAFTLVEGELLPWKKLPGISGLTASVNWRDDAGNLKLDSHNITLYPEAWLKDGVFLDSITGQLAFQKNTDKSWQVTSQAFSIWNDDLTLQLDGSIEKKEDGKIINDLSLQLKDIEINQWKKYVPQHGFNPLFKGWVNKAFPAGKIVDGTIRWQGDIAEFPYEEEPKKGLFDLALQVEGVQLHYASDWPDLMDVNAEITGSGNNLSIKSKHGTEAGFDFNYVTTEISKLIEKEPQLVTEADLIGTTEQALQFLLNSPLKRQFGKAVKTVKATGDSRIRFKLNVPLAHTDEAEVQGDVSFIDSALYEASATEVGVTKINGLLAFSNSGVSAEGMTAQLLNQDIVVNVKPTGSNTTISVAGKAATTDIKSVWPESMPDFISGEMDYNVNVTVIEESYGDFYVDAELSSNLKGLQITLPAPVKKDKESSKAFTASFKHIDDSLAYVIKYGEQFNAIMMNNTDLWRGELRFGVGEAKLPTLGVRVRGQMAELSIDDWLTLAEESTAEESLLMTSLDQVSIEVGTLKGFGQTFNHLNLSAEKDGQGWRTKIHSDQASGSIYIPTSFDNNAILKINLDKAQLSLPKTNTKKTVNDELVTPKELVLWPSMDIHIKSLFLEGMALGELDVQASQLAQSWRVNSATLTSDLFTATTIDNVENKNEWKRWATGDVSTIQLQAISKNISQLLTNFDYQKVIEAEDATFTINLSWPGAPLTLFDYPLQGRLTLDVGNGTLKEVEPGAAGRIFGLLSVAAIPQRLSLDFSDLFGQGFSFDSITGSFDLANGLATTDDFILKGAPARVEMRGPIDLINKRYNQTVTVRPNVSSTLPLAGAVAAGPVGLAAGAAILLFDKVAGTIFDTEIVNIISYSYDLTGPWDDPEMHVVKPKIK